MDEDEEGGEVERGRGLQFPIKIMRISIDLLPKNEGGDRNHQKQRVAGSLGCSSDPRETAAVEDCGDPAIVETYKNRGHGRRRRRTNHCDDRRCDFITSFLL